MTVTTYTTDDLLYLMSRLRDPKSGCPWDIRQTLETIVPHTLEEAYEVADAIAIGDMNHVREELGDLLFQVVFYCQIGQEKGWFDWREVVSGLVEKLIRRHPHVFPDASLQSRLPEGATISEEEIKQNWERIKEEERRIKSLSNRVNDTSRHSSALSDIASALPALVRAEKLQKRAAREGFDWPDIEPVFAKLHEEIDELKEVWYQSSGQSPDIDRLEDELGDVLFSCVNLARFLRVKADNALRRTNQKFERRFRFIEAELMQQSLDMKDCSLEMLDSLWEKAKKELAN